MALPEGTIVSPPGEIKGYATVALEAGQVHQFAGYSVIACGLNDIAIGDLYVMYCHCGPTLKLPSASGTTFSVGDTVEWDDTNNLCVASGDYSIGTATRAKAGGTTVAYVTMT
jgi:hypothetical protein